MIVTRAGVVQRQWWNVSISLGSKGQPCILSDLGSTRPQGQIRAIYGANVWAIALYHLVPGSAHAGLVGGLFFIWLMARRKEAGSGQPHPALGALQDQA